MRKFLIGAGILSLTSPLVASAQGFANFTVALTTITGWINLVIPFLLLLATLYFFWGLTKFILKAGDEEARKEAKDIMVWGVVAVFVMVSFWGLVGFLTNTFGVSGNQVTVSTAPTIPVIVPQPGL